MRLSAGQLNRTTLQRQLLLERQPWPVLDAVRHLVALQAQHAASPYLALWNRVGGFDPADLDTAFDEHRIVKASLLRITLHAVAAEDHPVLHAVMQPTLRASRLADRRFTRTGLTSADADASLPEVLTFLREARTNAEMQAMAAERFGDTAKTGLWWALRTFAPLIHAPTGPPWTFGQRPAYRVAPTSPYPSERADAMVELARRYLRAYGPATPADLAQFSTLYRPPAKEAFTALADELVHHTGPDGKPLVDLADGVIAEEDTPAPPRLLGMWDNALLAHVDRGRLVPADHKPVVIRRNGDMLPTVLVDGVVAGVWRAIDQGIEVTAFRRLPTAVWDELAEEAGSLAGMLAARDPLVYRRYGHWWESLPATQVRTLR